ncbi:MAG: DUF402 domain-containing protein [Chloroflexota bacterium]|jgi:hypothetical protein|nr:DUF402 domain-containing protein [Chloroflexota bacterium]
MKGNTDQVTVIKLDTNREETWRYPGRVIHRSPHSLLIEAFFNIDEVSFQGITLRRNDRSIERFYDDRWYNIFEIHDRDNDQLKAWYCNVTRPAEFTTGRIAYVDLALDVLVFPNGGFLVLDEDEFQELELEPKTRLQARKGLNKLITLANSGDLAQEINKVLK